MIGIVTTLATATCANCHGEIQQSKSDMETTPKWIHNANGLPFCPEPPPPIAEPVLNTITKTPGIKAVECEWKMQVNGTTQDWAAICPECDRVITRVWNGLDAQQPVDTPVHLHSVPVEED